MNPLGLMKFLTNSTATCVVYASDVYDNVTSIHLSYFQPYTTMSLIKWRCALGINSTSGINCNSNLPLITFATNEMLDIVNTTRKDAVIGTGGMPYVPTTISVFGTFLQILYWIIAIFIIVIVIRILIYLMMKYRGKHVEHEYLMNNASKESEQ